MQMITTVVLVNRETCPGNPTYT